jgi:hypothetical protein
MSELLWLIPISVSISLVLGGCRSETFQGIAIESGKTFLRITIGIALVCLALQIVLWTIPAVT